MKQRALRTDMLALPADIRSAQWAAWSPDGKEIAIEDNRGGGMRSLWIVHEDGSHAVKVLDYQGTTYGGLDWTADGKNIIYNALAGDGLQLFSVARAGGAPDLQRMISRTPTASLADLHKGDAVVVLSTEGTASGAGTAIQLVSGVEPILQAAPNAGQAMLLAPWSLGAPAADAGGP